MNQERKYQLRTAVRKALKNITLAFSIVLFLAAVFSVKYDVLWRDQDYKHYFRLQRGRVLLGWSTRPSTQRFAGDWHARSMRDLGFCWQPEIRRTNWACFVLIPLWIPLAATLIVIAILHHMGQATKRDQCAKCKYDLTGNLSGVCPECGSRIGNDVGQIPHVD